MTDNKLIEDAARAKAIAAAWAAWHARHGGKLGPGPAFAEAIDAVISVIAPAVRETCAAACETHSWARDVDWWLTATKKEATEVAARECAAAIRALSLDGLAGAPATPAPDMVCEACCGVGEDHEGEGPCWYCKGSGREAFIPAPDMMFTRDPAIRAAWDQFSANRPNADYYSFEQGFVSCRSGRYAAAAPASDSPLRKWWDDPEARVKMTAPNPVRLKQERFMRAYLEDHFPRELEEADAFAERCMADAATPAPDTVLVPREAVWPEGCIKPNSCARHDACMYMGCEHLGRDAAVLRNEIIADKKAKGA